MIMNCQRCDKDLRIAHGEKDDWVPDTHHNKLEGSFTFTGVYGSLKFDWERWEAELCESCCAELADWIDAGPGKGVFRFHWGQLQRASQRAADEAAGGTAKFEALSKEEQNKLILEEEDKILKPKLEEFLLETKETSKKGRLR